MNPLVTDDLSKRFYPWKDSGFIYTKQLIQNLPATWRFYWLIPESCLQYDTQWFTEANKNIDLIPYPYSTSIHQNRYEFYGSTLHSYFPYTTDIDVILNNQPEVSGSLKYWFLNRRDKPIIISFYHWIDCKLSQKFGHDFAGYFWRQYEGFLCSDLALFHNEYAFSLFFEEADKHIKQFGSTPVDYFHPKATYFKPEPFPLPDKKIILFNHRLNNTTQWQAVVDICKELYEVRQDFVLWITDGLSVKSHEVSDLPFATCYSLPSPEYGYLINNAHFAVCNHKGYSTWNMAVLDSLYNGCFTLMPYDGIYKVMFKDTNPNYGLFHNFKDLKQRMIRLLNSDRDVLQRRANSIVQESSVFNTRDTFLETLEYEILNRYKGAHAKNYKEVSQLIRENKTITKREMVTTIWEYKMNSNFQKIRWQLLKDGIKDFTESRKTVYYTGDIPLPTKRDDEQMVLQI